MTRASPKLTSITDNVRGSKCRRISLALRPSRSIPTTLQLLISPGLMARCTGWGDIRLPIAEAGLTASLVATRATAAALTGGMTAGASGAGAKADDDFGFRRDCGSGVGAGGGGWTRFAKAGG